MDGEGKLVDPRRRITSEDLLTFSLSCCCKGMQGNMFHPVLILQNRGNPADTNPQRWILMAVDTDIHLRRLCSSKIVKEMKMVLICPYFWFWYSPISLCLSTWRYCVLSSSQALLISVSWSGMFPTSYIIIVIASTYGVFHLYLAFYVSHPPPC